MRTKFACTATWNVQDMIMHYSKFLAAKFSAIVLNTNSSQTMNQLLLKVLFTVVFRVIFCLSCVPIFCSLSCDSEDREDYMSGLTVHVTSRNKV